MSRRLLNYFLPLIFLLVGGKYHSYCNTSRNIPSDQVQDLAATFLEVQQNEHATFINPATSHAGREMDICVAEVEVKEEEQHAPRKYLELSEYYSISFNSQTALSSKNSSLRLYEPHSIFPSCVSLTVFFGVFRI